MMEKSSSMKRLSASREQWEPGESYRTKITPELRTELAVGSAA